MPMLNWLDMERLASTRLASAAVTTGAITIPAREQLFLLINITGFSSAETAALRFNADSGTNYWDRHLTAIQGATTLVNAQNASTTMLRLAGLTSTTARSHMVSIINISNVTKSVTIAPYLPATGAAATVGGMDTGGGEWVNTSAQITSIELRSVGGTNTLSAGSGFTVYGSNP